jgi:hypothetical protein
METVGHLAKFFFHEIVPVMDWAITHWLVTLALLVLMIFWASHSRLTQKRH